jgi:hypothetical protein
MRVDVPTKRYVLPLFVYFKTSKVEKERQRCLFIVVWKTSRYKTLVEGTSLVDCKSSEDGSEWKSWTAE